jgi:hypothetical protein
VTLTKSNLQSFLQCPRKLWLERNQPQAADVQESTVERRSKDGQIVGEKAREALGREFIWPPVLDTVEETTANALRQISAAPDLPAAEFPFLRGDLYARTDALVPAADGYILRETKASTFPLKNDKLTPGNPDGHLIVDVAIQLYAAEASGLQIRRAELNLLNSQWRYPGDDDYSGLFRQLDVTAEARALLPKIQDWIDSAKATLANGLPTATTGKHCTDPYLCGFVTHCRNLDPPGPEHPITLLPDSAGKKLAKKLNESRGYVSILEPHPDELVGAGAELYKRIQQAHRENRSVRAPGAVEVLRALPYPRYYFDFEGIDLPVPRWAGVRPYEQIPFQWSCHIELEDGRFRHAAFLDTSGDDPSVSCIEKVLATIPVGESTPIFVYSATYEKTRLSELAKRHQQYEDAVQDYIGRLIDLQPLVKNHFYAPEMRGSFSIKKVLPVIAPDLDYGELDGVQEGTEAQLAYLRLAFEELQPDERKELQGDF